MPATMTDQYSQTLLATFHVGEALFALDAAAVQEVLRLGQVTPVPHAPREVIGVINLRGKIVTLLDTGLILGLGAAARGRESRVFLIEDRGEFLGLLVDGVGEVIEVETSASEPLPLNIPPAQSRYFTGVCRAGGRVLTLLNTSELLEGNHL
ncbi:MAG: chemotaxis protein CheW [Acidobacteria bacterium]|nr:chemotaxis protein CheW [Acidobacteriota bacterium]